MRIFYHLYLLEGENNFQVCHRVSLVSLDAFFSFFSRLPSPLLLNLCIVYLSFWFQEIFFYTSSLFAMGCTNR